MIIFFVHKPGKNVDFYIDGTFMFRAISGKKGEIKVNKKSDIGKSLLYALDNNRDVVLKA